MVAHGEPQGIIYVATMTTSVLLTSREIDVHHVEQVGKRGRWYLLRRVI